MNEFLLALRQFFRGFRCWIIVSPWEQALRVRRGKGVTVLGSGIHWKLPVIDSIYLQSVRLRLAPITKQTISTACGKTITVSGSFGYRIDDISLLYNSIHHAEDTIAAMVKSRVADYIARHRIAECDPDAVQREINGSLDFTQYGLGGSRFYLTEWAIVRTFRVIGDQSEYAWGNRLSTDIPTTSSTDRT